MAKTEFLQIRMTPESRQRLSRVAEADHLDESTWARRAILKALDRWEEDELRGGDAVASGAAAKSQLRKVAEGKPAKSRTRQAAEPKAKRTPRRKRNG